MSLDNVKKSVLDEVAAKAGNMVSEARKVAERLVAEGRAAAEQVKADALRDAKLRLTRETGREMERIQHENRLRILQAKNAVIDNVFDKIRDRLTAMPDPEYVGMIGGWLKTLPPGTGGVLRVNPKDEAKFSGHLADFNSGRSGSDKFTKVVSDPKVSSGAVVEGPDFAIDCTVERRLGELREAAAGNLAQKLFGA